MHIRTHKSTQSFWKKKINNWNGIFSTSGINFPHEHSEQDVACFIETNSSDTYNILITTRYILNKPLHITTNRSNGIYCSR